MTAVRVRLTRTGVIFCFLNCFQISYSTCYPRYLTECCILNTVVGVFTLCYDIFSGKYENIIITINVRFTYKTRREDHSSKHY